MLIVLLYHLKQRLISTLQNGDQESAAMLNKNGEKFLCYLPKVEKSRSKNLVNPQNKSSTIMETERRVKLKTPDELLEIFKNHCFLRVSTNLNHQEQL